MNDQRFKFIAGSIVYFLFSCGNPLDEPSLTPNARQSYLNETAPSRCGVHDSLGEGTSLLRPSAAMRLEAGQEAITVDVAVHFHILRPNQAENVPENIPESVLDNQIAALNTAFGGGQGPGASNTPFRFHKGSVERFQDGTFFVAAPTPGSPFGSPDTFEPNEVRVTTEHNVGGPSSLNIYTILGSGGAIGWSTFPWNYRLRPKEDHLSIAFDTFPGGARAGFNQGDTVVHEVGHWLGLHHTFLGGCTDGDLVSDTPAEASAATPTSMCDLNRDSCPMQPGNDPVDNFMDLGDDVCMRKFTTGQAGRAFENWRFFRAPKGDFDGNGRSDVALTGGAGWGSIPVAYGQQNGHIRTNTNEQVGDFPFFAQCCGAQPVPGDFNGDGRADIALTRGGGWGSIPVALSNGNGTFDSRNVDLAPEEVEFAIWAQNPTVKALGCDFNGDGLSDIALVGGTGWGSIPVAFSAGDGSFHRTNFDITGFPIWAQFSGAKVIPGDFNGDMLCDIALTGFSGGGSIPVAFSLGNGNFSVQNVDIPGFPQWAASPGMKAVAGDFDGDGKADIAITGANFPGAIPIAFSNGNGSFRTVANQPAPSTFVQQAAQSGAKLVVGDFDGDGKGDIAITGIAGGPPGPGQGASIPVVLSNGSGSFRLPVAMPSQLQWQFPSWATPAEVKPVGAY